MKNKHWWAIQIGNYKEHDVYLMDRIWETRAAARAFFDQEYNGCEWKIVKIKVVK